MPVTLALLLLAQAPAAPTKVFVGAYAYSISDVNIAAGTYQWDGYLWFRWEGDAIGTGPMEFVVPNGSIETIDEVPVVHVGTVHRHSRRVTLRLKADFDLADYPFDEQTLPMVIEHRWLGSDQLVFVPDDGAVPAGKSLRDAFLSRELTIGDWRIDKVAHSTTTKQYETDFGSIQKGAWAGTSSRYVLQVFINRHLLPYVLKFVLPLLLIVAMGFSVFFISPKEFGTQTGIVVTALLSCVAFHMSQANSLPEVGYLVTADLFFLLSYLFVFIALAVIVRTNAWVHRDDLARAERTLRIVRVAVPGTYLAAMGVLLATS